MDPALALSSPSSASGDVSPEPASAASREVVPVPASSWESLEALFAGRYRIDSVLGTGAMGVVYAATHVELRLPLAIKIIHPSLVHLQEARDRFCIEARAGAALRSPHVLRVYDAGQLGSAECFIVMERLEGLNLEELVAARGPLRPEVAVDYVMQACAGLAEAHAIGVVHRDIKPENLFLAHYRCSAPLIKIMDFGVARWRGQYAGQPRLTNPRSAVGSPCYQSPEQMQNAADVDERSDIWSLGLVLFELLTGYCPFESETIAETCWKVLQGPRPSLAAARPGLEPGLELVFQRCLALHRSNRYASVRQLAAALQPFSSAALGAAAALRKPARGQLGRDPLRERSSATMRRQFLPAQQGVPSPLHSRAAPSRRRRVTRTVSLAAAFLLGVVVTVVLHRLDPRFQALAQLLRPSSSNSPEAPAPGASACWASTPSSVEPLSANACAPAAPGPPPALGWPLP